MKHLLYISVFMFTITAFSQTAEQEKEMNAIINYVQETQQEGTFAVENIRQQNDQGEEVVTTYYVDQKQIFCIIHNVYAKVQKETTYYLKNNELILSIIREDAAKPDEIYYFIKDKQLINPEDLHTDYPLEKVLQDCHILVERF
ncbi:MAG TPA: hypothetical protein VKY32_07315 [Flavobacterium sp.]|nr:hypothetical protein [Flavobacterium sp.]